MERVVNIIGMGISSQDVPDTGENWIINIAYKKIKDKKISKMFYMDDLIKDVLPADPLVAPIDYTFDKFLELNPDVELITKFDGKINDLNGKEIKTVKAYPLNKAVELISGGFFTSTIAYVLAYAILEKVDRIRLYGFEIWAGSDANEYLYQRPCLEFLIAFAIGRGIKIEVPYMLMQNVQNQQNYYGYLNGELIQNTRR